MTGGWQPAQQPHTDTSGDFVTAQAVIARHKPFTDPRDVQRCASARHAWSRLGPPWPCLRARLAQRTIDAHERAKANPVGLTPGVTP